MRAVVVACAVVIAAPTAARADPPFTIGGQPSWFVLAGATGGAALYDTRAGFVGGEVSVVRLRQGRLIGAYADAYYDFGVDGTYVTGGVELGRKLGPIGVGVDGGVAARFAYGDRDLGATGRLFGSAGVVSIYVRYVTLDGTDRNDHVVQVGATLKFPLVSPW